MSCDIDEPLTYAGDQADWQQLQQIGSVDLLQAADFCTCALQELVMTTFEGYLQGGNDHCTVLRANTYLLQDAPNQVDEALPGNINLVQREQGPV